MLIVHRLWAGGHRYYLAAVGPDRTDAPALGETPGRWMGEGARLVGLAGAVEADDLRRVLPSGRGRVGGFDLTFAAPKSVSVLHGLGPPAVASAVRAAHDTAVAAGIRHLEQHACAVRAAGQVVEAPGLAVAAFRHRVSRADDPHLHTHALVANVAAAPDDGRPLALHSPLLYGERRAAGAVYHTVLRAELTTALGVGWTPAVAGRADIAEVPTGICALFSRRRAAILAGAGDEVADRRWSERVSRPEREGLIDARALERTWRARARGWGWEVPELGPGREVEPSRVDPEDVIPATDRWTRADVVVAIATAWRDGGSAALLRAESDRVLARGDVMPSGSPGSGRQAVQRYTTVEAARRQLRVSEALGWSPQPGPWRGDPAGPRPREAGWTGTGTAASRLVPPGDRPEELDRLRRELATEGHRLLVVAPDAATAAWLADRTGAITAAATGAADAIGELGLGAGDVVVLLRAHRLGSAHVAAVLEAAGQRSVAAVAAHPRGPAPAESAPQLPLEPGGQPVARLPPEPERQGAPHPRPGPRPGTAQQPGTEGRRPPGAGQEALTPPSGPIATVLHSGGDVTVAASASLASTTAIEDWLHARQAGRLAVLVSPAVEVDDVNARARRALRSAGLLGADDVGGLAAGDLARFGASRPTLGIKRHDVAHVAAVEPGAGRVQLILADGRRLDLTASQMGTVHPAHAVPPIPALVAGRGEVFAIGGRAVGQRHLDGPVHRYITVAVEDSVHGPVAARGASLAELAAREGDVRERTRLPPSLTGERRRLEDRGREAAAWVAEAEQRHRAAVRAGDRVAQVAWQAQRAAAATEVASVRDGELDLSHRETVRAALDHAAAPARAELGAIEAHVALREAALVCAAELDCPRSLADTVGPAPPDPACRHRWREQVRPVLAATERGLEPVSRPPRRPSHDRQADEFSLSL